ncbi:MAG: HAD-IA family hydrolase [Caulobacterales bacterium]|nr:HAD-IA family hydrolase [Caulobacterales bacterium]
MRKALIFDCDGVLVDTERDGHRVAFNEAFREKGVPVVWDSDLYARLLQVAGGKERMRAYFDAYGWPADAADRDAFIRDLHAAKSRIFLNLLADAAMAPRPGVARLVDEARALGLKLGVCSTSKLESVHGCLSLLGPERAAAFDVVLAGDVVTRKKPDPEIYDLAKERLGLSGEECVVVEDSAIGCRSAVAAGMRVVVTTSAYTREEDFAGAFLIAPELGEAPNERVRLEDIIG